MSLCRTRDDVACRDIGSSDVAIAAAAHVELILTTSPTLSRLRFRSGPYVGGSVEQARASLDPERIAGFAEVLALSFADCLDHGVLAPRS
jgi:hypothetical protein